MLLTIVVDPPEPEAAGGGELVDPLKPPESYDELLLEGLTDVPGFMVVPAIPRTGEPGRPVGGGGALGEGGADGDGGIGPVYGGGVVGPPDPGLGAGGGPGIGGGGGDGGEVPPAVGPWPGPGGGGAGVDPDPPVDPAFC